MEKHSEGALKHPDDLFLKIVMNASQAVLCCVALQVEKLGHFMMKVKRPMAIGTVMLDDGNSCLGFVAEGWVASDASTEDISHFGSWLRYMDARGSQP